MKGRNVAKNTLSVPPFLPTPGRMYGADDFLPVLTYVIAQCDMLELDTEVEYMMELLDPSLLHGEGSRLLENGQEGRWRCLLRASSGRDQPSCPGGSSLRWGFPSAQPPMGRRGVGKGAQREARRVLQQLLLLCGVSTLACLLFLVLGAF